MATIPAIPKTAREANVGTSGSADPDPATFADIYGDKASDNDGDAKPEPPSNEEVRGDTSLVDGNGARTSEAQATRAHDLQTAGGTARAAETDLAPLVEAVESGTDRIRPDWFSEAAMVDPSTAPMQIASLRVASPATSLDQASDVAPSITPEVAASDQEHQPMSIIQRPEVPSASETAPAEPVLKPRPDASEESEPTEELTGFPDDSSAEKLGRGTETHTGRDLEGASTSTHQGDAGTQVLSASEPEAPDVESAHPGGEGANLSQVNQVEGQHPLSSAEAVPSSAVSQPELDDSDSSRSVETGQVDAPLSPGSSAALDRHASAPTSSNSEQVVNAALPAQIRDLEARLHSDDRRMSDELGRLHQDFRKDTATIPAGPSTSGLAASPTAAAPPIAIDTKALGAIGDVNMDAGVVPDADIAAAEFTRSPSAASTMARVEPAQVVRVITQSVIDIVRSPNGGTIDIGLSPEELGSVRLSLQASEGGITVGVSAERAETLELLRRNIGLLQQDLSQLGYSDIAFDFGRSGQGGGNEHAVFDDQDASSASAEPVARPTDIALPTAEKATKHGLDLRL